MAFVELLSSYPTCSCIDCDGATKVGGQQKGRRYCGLRRKAQGLDALELTRSSCTTSRACCDATRRVILLERASELIALPRVSTGSASRGGSRGGHDIIPNATGLVASSRCRCGAIVSVSRLASGLRPATDLLAAPRKVDTFQNMHDFAARIGRVHVYTQYVCM